MEDIKDVKYFSLKKLNKFLKEQEANQHLAKELCALLPHKDLIISMRASWVLLHLSFKKPELIYPIIPKLINFLNQTGQHTGAIRNVVRIFQDIDLPAKHCGAVFDLCIRFLKNASLPHAIRVFSLYVLTNICIKYPDLKPELDLIISELKSFPQPPSMLAGLKKTTKLLSKL